MTIILDHNFIAMWYFQIEKECDFLAGLTAKHDPSPVPQPINLDEKQEIAFTYRFRYYKDDNVFHSEDEKHWYGIEIKDHTPQQVLILMREMIHKLASVTQSEVTEIVVDERGPEGVMERMSKHSFFHARKEEPHEA